ncbi:hypothetical protein C8R43DRAFT_1007916 [Mycena crocata]|nr:hypothetical protein C8R43DRAFT_1007916 [Mycena crocata]
MSAENPFAAFAALTLGSLEDSLGVFYIGYTLAAVGYGFTFFQSYFYYTRYPKDHWLDQATVISLCILDTAMSALSSHTLYHYFVDLFALPVLPDEATTSFCVEILLSGFAVCIVQSYYAIRIWRASQSPVLAGAIILVSVAAAALGIATTVVMLKNTLFANFAERYMKTIISTGQGLRLLSAIMTSAGLLVYGAMPAGDGEQSLWNPFTSFMTSGIAGALVQLICFIMFLATPKRYLWIVFHFASSRIFINGLLLMLNSRAVSRGRGTYDSAEETRVTRGNVSHSKTAASDLLFNTTSVVGRNNHAVNIEVSRVVDTDHGDKGKMYGGKVYDGSSDMDSVGFSFKR